MTKLSRRGLFGAGAGAVIAGPSAIKSVLSVENSGLVPSRDWAGSKSLGGSIVGLNPVDNPDWLQEQFKNLLKERSQLEKMPLEKYGMPITNLCIDNLRSVSMPNRARMVAEENARRERAHQLKWMDKRLAELLDQLGPLGKLVSMI